MKLKDHYKIVVFYTSFPFKNFLRSLLKFHLSLKSRKALISLAQRAFIKTLTISQLKLYFNLYNT